MQKDVLYKYENILHFYLNTLNLKVGKGIFHFINPHQLTDRLKLLGGSIIAGNNAVIPEFSQIAQSL